jgi:hypothetical protein
MPNQLNFSVTHKYDSAKGGIVIPVSLILAEKVIECQARVDTGAEYCLFARSYADQLGLDVESGHEMEMGTLTTSFPAFGACDHVANSEYGIRVYGLLPAVLRNQTEFTRKEWVVTLHTSRDRRLR